MSTEMDDLVRPCRRIDLDQSAEASSLVQRVAKDSLHRCLRGYVSETVVFEVLKKYDIPHVRSWETAPVDGALFEPLADTAPRPDWNDATRTLKWIGDARGRVRFIEFDVKFASIRKRQLRSGSWVQDNRYEHTVYPGGHKEETAAVYIIVLEGLSDYLAVLPRDVFIQRRSQNTYNLHGTLGLTAHVSPWLFPFMVHETCLKSTFESFFDTDSPDVWPRNTSTGVVFSGWSPAVTLVPRLTPTGEGSMQPASYNAIYALWEQLSASGARTGINCFQPYLYDFLIHLPSGPSVRIEHKSTREVSGAVYRVIKLEKSPFRPDRQWHFLLYQPSADASLLFVIPRHRVTDAWSKWNSVPLRGGYFQEFSGPGHVDRMIQFMCAQAKAAIDAAVKAACLQRPWSLGDAAAMESDVPDNVSSDDGAGDEPSPERGTRGRSGGRYGVDGGEAGRVVIDRGAAYAAGADETVPDVPRGWAGRESTYNLGCFWLVDEVNYQFSRGRRHVVVANDPGHPLGNAFVMDAADVWTREAQAAFRQRSDLPLLPFSPEARDRRAVVLKLTEMHHDQEIHAIQPKPLTLMSHSYAWAAWFEKQDYILIGSTALPAYLPYLADPPPYLVFPSEFLTHLDDGNAHPSRDDSQGGKRYFRQEGWQKGTILPRDGAHGGMYPFQPGDHYQRKWARPSSHENKEPLHLIRSESTDPLRHLVDHDAGKLHDHLCELFGPGDKMRVATEQGYDLNPEFEKRKYHTTVRAILQASWDHGRKYLVHAYPLPRS